MACESTAFGVRGPPVSTSEPWIPPLKNGFWGRTLYMQDLACKAFNMVLDKWQMFYLIASSSFLDWILKEKAV